MEPGEVEDSVDIRSALGRAVAESDSPTLVDVVAQLRADNIEGAPLARA